MNYRKCAALVFAAAAAGIAGACLVSAARAQVPAGPIAPLKKMEFKQVNPLGSAKLPAMAPGAGSTHRHAGTVSQPVRAKGGGSAYYPDMNQPKGARMGGAAYSAPGTTRKPILATGGGGGSWRGDGAGSGRGSWRGDGAGSGRGSWCGDGTGSGRGSWRGGDR